MPGSVLVWFSMLSDSGERQGGESGRPKREKAEDKYLSITICQSKRMRRGLGKIADGFSYLLITSTGVACEGKIQHHDPAVVDRADLADL